MLELLPFLAAPGTIISDDLDLSVNPLGYLTRALTLWDPQQFGQLRASP